MFRIRSRATESIPRRKAPRSSPAHFIRRSSRCCTRDNKPKLRRKKTTAGIASGCRSYSDLIFASALLRLLRGRQRLQARVQAALIAGNGVRMQGALLHALVEGRNGGPVLRLCFLHVAFGKRLAQRAQACPHAAPV